MNLKDLANSDATELMAHMVSGEASDAQIAAALTALRCKGATASELAAFAQILRERVLEIDVNQPTLVDTCGTGGGIPSFNISTAAALVAAAAGAKVAKHGNRAVTSSCGSADVLEALGVRLGEDPQKLLHQIETIGIIFLFAPAHHPVMKFVGSVRKSLGFRTVFNQLGPLANPAGARRQIVGVFDQSLCRPMAEALNLLDAQRAMVVHGSDGLDEISPCGPTHTCTVEGGMVQERTLTSADFGLEPLPAGAIAPGDSLEENARILTEAISDVNSLRSQAIVPSAAAAIWLAGLDDNLAAAAQRARQAISEGGALAKLFALQQEST